MNAVFWLVHHIECIIATEHLVLDPLNQSVPEDIKLAKSDKKAHFRPLAQQ